MRKKIKLIIALITMLVGIQFAFSSCTRGRLKGINQFNYEHEKTGYWVIADSTGCKDIQHYSHGSLQGKFMRYGANGKLSISGRFDNGVKVGTWKYYDQKGLLLSWNKYRDGYVYKSFIGEPSW